MSGRRCHRHRHRDRHRHRHRQDPASTIIRCAIAGGLAAGLVASLFIAVLAANGAAPAAPAAPAQQSRQNTRSSRVENVVQAVRRSYEQRPPEWRRRAAPCLHYLDEAESFHNQGEAYFVAASRARSSPEQTRLVRLGNDAIHERTRLINEFWACTRRMTSGDVFASQDPPRNKDTPPPDDPTPPHDPIDPPPGRLPNPIPPERPNPPHDPGSFLPPGFPFPPAEAAPRRTPRDPRPAPVPVIVALGDSITAGYKLRPAEAYSEVIQRKLQADGYRYHVMNAGVTKDTAAGARRRVAQALVPNTRILIVAIGLNDYMAGRPIPEVTADIGAIIQTAQRSGISVLLCGFVTPLPVDPTYDRDFARMYTALAARYRVPLVRDPMTKVWNTEGFTLADGVHPNAAGAQDIADRIYQGLRPMLTPSAPLSSPSASRRPMR